MKKRIADKTGKIEEKRVGCKRQQRSENINLLPADKEENKAITCGGKKKIWKRKKLACS